MRVVKLAMGGALFLSMFSGMAFAASRSFQGDVERAVTLQSELGHLHITGLEVTVRGGMATLEGTTDSLFEKRKATDIARKIPGVDEVSNDLSVVAVKDEPLEQAAREALEKDHHYTIYDQVGLTAANGRVTLEGRLAPAGDPKAIEESISKVRGVAAIDNRIRVLPYSDADERLREAIAIGVCNALGEKHFSQSGAHIVVENGRVTLLGSVADDSVRKSAEEVARRTEGVTSVENLLTLSSTSGELGPS